MAELVLQPSVKDTYLFSSSPDSNYGSNTNLYLEKGSTPDRIVLEFNITDYEDISAINSASLYLYYYNWGENNPTGETVWAYKMTRTDWVETGATWNSYKSGSSWTTAGGDYVTSSPAGGSTTMPGSAGAWITLNVLAIVQDALASGVVRFIIKFETESGTDKGANFYSREYATEASRPKLVLDVDYKPDPPTNVAATQGDHSDKVVVTWTKSDYADDYQVYKDGVGQGWLGDVATFTDNEALEPGAAAATKGTYGTLVKVILEDYDEFDDQHFYKVKAKDQYENESDYSDEVLGYREYAAPVYQWQRSAADSDADYSNITGATDEEYKDTGAPVCPSARYYRCQVTLGGGSAQYSDADRGWRKRVDAPHNIPGLVIKDKDLDTLAYVKDAWGIGYDYRVNELPILEFNIPAGGDAAAHLAYPNEVCYYNDNVLKDIFKIINVVPGRDDRASIHVTCKQAGYTLNKDIIPSYSCDESDGKKTSDILGELLDYQEVESITLGGVAPELDIVIAIDMKNKTIWEACNLVRDTVGGYLYVEVDKDDPSTRELWLAYEIGENKGQQVRLGKNLVGVKQNKDYIQYCNRLYPIGSSDLLINTKTYTRQDATKSSDVSYGYLNLSGLYAAYKDWTGVGDALPGNVTVEKPTGAFVSFTGHEESEEWDDPEKAYDDDDETYAKYYPWQRRSWTPWYIATISAKATTQIKWWGFLAFWWDHEYFPLTQIDIYYSGAWHNVFDGRISDKIQTEGQWLTCSFAQQTITKARIRFYNIQSYGLPYPQNLICKHYEMYLWDATGYADETSKWKQGADENTLRCAIGDYDSAAPYVVSYTHAAYLIDTSGISGRADIISSKAAISASDVDALIGLGRTKLTELKEPVQSIDIDMIDFSAEEGRSFEEFELGDMVTVIDEDLNIEEEVRVVRIRKPNLDLPEDIRIELANKTKDIIDSL